MVLLVDQCPGGESLQVSGDDMARVKERAAVLCKTFDAYLSNQLENSTNPDFHYTTTAPELWEQCHRQLDMVLTFAETGGALSGLSRFFRSVKRAVHVYPVELAEATAMVPACCREATHCIQGGGYGKLELPLICKSNIDADAIHFARVLAAEEGIFAGYSIGAHLHAVVELLRGPKIGKTVAFLVCDTGMKCLSTDLYP